MGPVIRMGIPGKFPSLTLGIVAILTVIFPIVSLPCSITGFVQARVAKRFIENNHMAPDAVAKVAYYLNLVAIITTAGIILISLPGAIARNQL